MALTAAQISDIKGNLHKGDYIVDGSSGAIYDYTGTMLTTGLAGNFCEWVWTSPGGWVKNPATTCPLGSGKCDAPAAVAETNPVGTVVKTPCH